MEIIENKLTDLSLLVATARWTDLSKVGQILSGAETLLEELNTAGLSAVKPEIENWIELLSGFIMADYTDKQQAIDKIQQCFNTLESGLRTTIETGATAQGSNSTEPVSESESGAGQVLTQEQIAEIKEYTANSIGTMEELEQKFLELEQTGSTTDSIDAIFRIVHTLKGETGFAGMKNVSELCHHLESVFTLLRKHPVSLNPHSIDTFLTAKDAILTTFTDCKTDTLAAVDVRFSELVQTLEDIKLSLDSGHYTSKPNSVTESETGEETPTFERHVERLELEKIEDISLLKDFASEAIEHLDGIENLMLDLENNPDDDQVLNDIFRPLHTIKGVSSFLELKHINKVSHESETLLDLARSGVFVMDKECRDIVFDVVDTLQQLIKLICIQIEGESFEDDDYPFVEALIHTLKTTIRQKTTPSVPKSSTSIKSPKKLGELLVEEKVVSQQDLSKALIKQEQGGGKEKVGEILIKEKKVAPKQVAGALRKQKDYGNTVKSDTIKVNTTKLDNLIDMVGELVISQAMLEQNPLVLSRTDPDLYKMITQSNKIVRDIQHSSMSLRMIPVKQTFQKMARLVRDLANKSGKIVDLEIAGAETELDRNVIDKINDPLVHMIRNSVDHGIEQPKDRERAGKNANGTVNLNAYHQGGNIVIEIRDDGKGLDQQAILNKAVEKGLITEGTNLNDVEIYNLIFQPGFSTAKQITDVSGRGVGMDVVKKNIESLGGTVAIDSHPGKGSIFTIRLPLTMAIMDGMIVQVGGERYLLPVLSIIESIRPEASDVSTVQGKGEMVKVRGNLIQVIRIHELFNLKPLYTHPSEALVIIVDIMGRSYGLMVDKLLGQQQVVIKSLKGDLRKVEGISGSAILGDGRVGLILDPKGLVSVGKKNEQNDGNISDKDLLYQEFEKELVNEP